MFFELHGERKIGYKQLSPADLGIKITSNQTHIGLAADVLTFMSDKNEINEDSILIYENSFDYLDAHFDRIKRESGEFNAPKIKMGGRNIISIAVAIRDAARRNDPLLKWFLFWFGLKNEKMVFLLFNENSNNFKDICRLGINLSSLSRGAKVVDPHLTDAIAAFVEERVNENGLPTVKTLEEELQLGVIQPNRKIAGYDIERANEMFKMISRMGETLINKYLETQKQKNNIRHYAWYNRERESGLPYDFHYEDANGNVVHVSVKTTKYEFNQKIIFSSQELEYISKLDTNYSIYRVYFNNENIPHVRVCDNCKDIAKQISNLTNAYRKNLLPIYTEFKDAKLAISTENELLNFTQEIMLV